MKNIHNKIYLIGDIHGCNATLRKMLYSTLQIQEEDTIIFLGDYTDRGIDSKGVLDTLMEIDTNNKYKTIFLRGNHDQMMIDAIQNNYFSDDWIKNGGMKTLNSFGINNPKDIDKKYLNFLKNTTFYYENEYFIAVHAGLNFSVSNPFSDFYSMMNIRGINVDTIQTKGRPLIIGHTPLRVEKIKKTLHTHKIMLDGGCVYKNKLPYLGKLVALEYFSRDLFFVENIDE